MLLYCPLHRSAFNRDLDPVCPQCTLTRQPAPEPWEVDERSDSETRGMPIVPEGTQRPAVLPNVLGGPAFRFMRERP